MGIEVIKQLLDKYWQAETSLEEERVLAEYFRGPEVAEELESYRSLFDWIGEETAVTAPAGFEEKILAQIEGNGLRAGAEESQGEDTGGSFAHRTPRWRMHYAVAAALVLCVTSVFLVARIGSSETAGSDATAAQHSNLAAEQANEASLPPTPQVKDTYKDPEKALAVVRQALLRVSVSMNEGRRITQKNMHLMDHSWQAAVSN